MDDEFVFVHDENKTRYRDNRKAMSKAKRRAKELYEHIGSYPSGARKITKGKCHIDAPALSYVRCARFSKRGQKSASHFLKKYNNKKMRKIPLASGGAYKKATEYIWCLI